MSSFSHLSLLTGLCQRRVNCKPFTASYSHSLQTSRNNNRDPTPSCCQRMDGQTPWLSSLRPGDLAPAHLSVISYPLCPDAWAQLSPEWAVAFFFSSYLMGPSLCLGSSYSLLPLTISSLHPLSFKGSAPVKPPPGSFPWLLPVPSLLLHLFPLLGSHSTLRVPCT